MTSSSSWDATIRDTARCDKMLRMLRLQTKEEGCLHFAFDAADPNLRMKQNEIATCFAIAKSLLLSLLFLPP